VIYQYVTRICLCNNIFQYIVISTFTASCHGVFDFFLLQMQDCIQFLSAKIGVATNIARWYILSPKRKTQPRFALLAKPRHPVIKSFSDCSCINIACELETKTHRDLNKMPFANLDKYFGVKRKNDEDLNEIQNCAKVARTDSSDATLSKCKKVCDAWLSVWSQNFPWIDKIDYDGQTRAICHWCKECGKVNSMATTGSSNLQSSAFSRHETSRDHLLAAEAHHAKQRKATVQHVSNIFVSICRAFLTITSIKTTVI